MCEDEIKTLFYTFTRSKTVSRAAQPNLHRRCNRLLQVAARKVSAEPKVQRLLRAERVNRVALDVAQSRHGRKCASAEFLRPRATFSEFCSPLDYVSARIKFFQKYEKLVTHDRRTVQYRGPRRKYFRWGKRSSRATDERRHFAPPRQASASCDAVGEESPNGATRKMYILRGAPGRRGHNTFMSGDVKLVKIYSLTSLWARINISHDNGK